MKVKPEVERMLTIYEEVDNFVVLLKSNGYTVESNNREIEEFKVTGKGIRGYFSMHELSHPYEYFRFAFDNAGTPLF